MRNMLVIGLDGLKSLKLLKDTFTRMDDCIEIYFNEDDYALLREEANIYESTEQDYDKIIALINEAKIYKDYVESINSLTNVSIWIFNDFFINQGLNYNKIILDQLNILSKLCEKEDSNINDMNFIVSGMECYELHKIYDGKISDYSLIKNEVERIKSNTVEYLNNIDNLLMNKCVNVNIFMVPGSYKFSFTQKADSLYEFLRVILQFEYWLSSRVNDYFQNENIHLYCKDFTINYADAIDLSDEIYCYYSSEVKSFNKYYLGDKHSCSIKRLINIVKGVSEIAVNPVNSQDFITGIDAILDKQLLYTMPYILDARAVNINENIDNEVLYKLEKKIKEYIEIINQKIIHINTVLFTQKHINIDNGDTITYYTAGKGQPIYIINAYGVDVDAWKPFVSTLAEKYYFVIGEVRGVKQKKTINGSTDGFGVYDHVDDIEKIVANEKLDKFHLISWCSGVKQAFIFTQKNSEKILSNIILAGEFAPYENSQKEHSKFSESVKEVYKLINEDKRILEYYMKIIFQGIFTTTIDYERLMNKVKCSEINNATDFVFQIVPDNEKEIILDTYSSSDKMIRFLEMCVEYYTHDVEEIIHTTEIPTLIISAEKDAVANCKQAEWADRSLKYSNYIILPEATHWIIRERIDDLCNLINTHNKICHRELAKRYY